MEKVTVRTHGNYETDITARSHTWHADAPIEDGGKDIAPTPEEEVLGAIGACMAVTGKMYAARKGWALDEIEVVMDMEKINAGNYPAYTGEASFIHEIREDITLKGDLTTDQRERVLDIMRKCPVRRLVTNPIFFVERVIEAESLLD